MDVGEFIVSGLMSLVVGLVGYAWGFRRGGQYGIHWTVLMVRDIARARMEPDDFERFYAAMSQGILKQSERYG